MASRRRPVKRAYDSPLRAEAAESTRRAILSAARELFLEHGYEAMTMKAVADNAGVALDTVYEVVGKKPLLAKLLVETALSNTDQEVPAEQRDYVRRIHAATDARDKLTIYADAVVDIHTRLAPLVSALQRAAPRHPELAEMWREISERRARNMRLLARELLQTGQTRRGIDETFIADVLWVLAAADVYLLFVDQRKWSPRDVAAYLRDAWCRAFLVDADDALT